MEYEEVTCTRCGSIMKEDGYAFNAINYPRFICGCGNVAVAYLPFSLDRFNEAMRKIGRWLADMKTRVHFINRYGVKSYQDTVKPDYWITHIEKHGGRVTSTEIVPKRVGKADHGLLSGVFQGE